MRLLILRTYRIDLLDFQGKNILEIIPIYVWTPLRSPTYKFLYNFTVFFQPFSFYIAGTTITQEITYLLRHDGDTSLANKEYNYIRVPYLDNAFPPHTNGLTLFSELQHPRHLKTHLPFKFMPEKVTTRGIKCIYVLRNPKDSLVSYYYFYKSVASFGKFTGSWSDFFEMFLHDNLCYGSILDHYIEWWKHRHDDNILVLKYEDLLKTPKDQIWKIAKFLKLNTTEEIVDKVDEFTKFKNMKANPATNWTTIPEDVDCSISPFMRKGQIGDWRNHFTVAQNDLFDQIIASKLRGLDLDFDYGA